MLVPGESWRFNLGKFIKFNITIGIHSALQEQFQTTNTVTTTWTLRYLNWVMETGI